MLEVMTVAKIWTPNFGVSFKLKIHISNIVYKINIVTSEQDKYFKAIGDLLMLYGLLLSIRSSSVGSFFNNNSVSVV